MFVADRKIHIGVDLGQRRNHTAIVVVEQQIVHTGAHQPGNWAPICQRRLVVRLAERMPLRTDYEVVKKRVLALADGLDVPKGDVTVAIDATGGGSAFCKDLRSARVRGEQMDVVITGGQQGRSDGKECFVPRADLLMGVVMAFNSGVLGVARGVEGWKLLREELLQMRRVARGGEMRIETTGPQDDLVFALALALFGASQRVLRTEGDRLWRKVLGEERWRASL